MNTDTIIILGAGYTGREITRLAREFDVDVVGTSRDDETLEFLERHGATPVRWSVDQDPAGWTEHLGPSTSVVYSIPTLYNDYQPADNGRLPRHVEPVDDAVQACRHHGAARFVYLSSTSVYGDHDGKWVDETDERRPTAPYGKMRADIERHLMDLSADFPINVARLVGIYGPGRTLVDFIESGRYTLVDDGKSVSNRVHVRDIARVVLRLIEDGPRHNRIYNVTDGHPQTSRDLVEFICDRTGIEPPPTETLEAYIERRDNPNAVARRKNTIRVLNDRLREELDYSFVYPDVFAGYEAILGDEDNGPSTPSRAAVSQ